MTESQHPVPYQLRAGERLRGRWLRQVSFDEMGFDQLAGDALDADSDLNGEAEGAFPMMETLRRGGIETREDIRRVLEQAFNRATGLRHAASIRADMAARWLSNTFIQDPLRLDWHVKRLDGVSPSSAGAYVAESRGSRSTWTTARELDMTRLMIRLPSRPTWHTSRGTVLEELNRRILFARYRQLTPDHQGLEAVRNVRGTQAMPWLVGNPDDLAFAETSSGQRRVIIDEKCPAKPKHEDDPFLLDYDVQLHCYAMLCDAAQRPVRDIALSHLYVSEDIARLWAQILTEQPAYIDELFKQARFAQSRGADYIEHTLQFMTVSQSLKEEIADVCASADARVQMGRMAPWPQKRTVELSEQLESESMRHQTYLAQAIPVLNVLKDHVDGSKKTLAALLEDVDLKNARQPLPHLSLMQVAKLDVDRAVDSLRAAGVDTRPFENRVPQVSYDMKQLRAALEEAGIPVHTVENVSINIGLTRKKTGAPAESKRLAAERAEEIVADLGTAIENGLGRPSRAQTTLQPEFSE